MKDLDPVEKVNNFRVKQQAAREERRVAIQLEVDRLTCEREEKRLYVRKRTPKLSIVIHAFKDVFGDDQVRVLSVEEDGFVIKAKGFRGF